MEEKKKELLSANPVLDFKKKLKSNNFSTPKTRTQQFVQKPMKKVTGRGR